MNLYFDHLTEIAKNTEWIMQRLRRDDVNLSPSFVHFNGVTTEQVATAAGVSLTDTRQALMDLVDAGEVMRAHCGPTTRWLPSNFLDHVT
jgi:hypothetical protein